MKKFIILYSLLLFCFHTYIYGEENKNNDANKFKYTSVGIEIIQTDKTAIGATASIGLPGSLYVVLELFPPQ